MLYRYLTDMVILLHLLWILFLVFGILLVLVRPKIAILHLAGLLFSFFLNLMGWFCPLTYLENYLRTLYAPDSTHLATFVARHAQRLIYPDLPENLIRIGEMVFVGIYILCYIYVAKRKGVFGSARKDPDDR